MNAYILLVILLIILLFVHHYQRRLSILKVLIGLCAFAVFTFIAFCVSGNTEKFPMIQKEKVSEVSVDSEYSMYLSYGSVSRSC